MHYSTIRLVSSIFEFVRGLAYSLGGYCHSAIPQNGSVYISKNGIFDDQRRGNAFRDHHDQPTFNLLKGNVENFG